LVGLPCWKPAVLGGGSEKYRAIARLLINAGADKSIKERNGKTSLDHAEERGHVKILK